jgi:hypothetical protein
MRPFDCKDKDSTLLLNEQVIGHNDQNKNYWMVMHNFGCNYIIEYLGDSTYSSKLKGL